MKKIIFAAALAAITLVACDRSEQVANDLREVKFRVENIGTYTMKSYVALNETPGEGDEAQSVGIYSSSLNVTNMAASVSGGVLTPESPIYWAAGQTANSDFVAVYPRSARSDLASSEYNLPSAQNEGDNYSYNVNLVTAAQSVAPNNTVAFAFKHPFAQIVVNVTNNLGEDKVSTVSISGIRLNATALDITSAPAAVTVDDASGTTVTAKAITANTQYAAVVLPQTGATPVITVTTTLGSVYTFNITSAYNFVAGKKAVAAITLDPQGGASSGVTSNPASFSLDTENFEEWTDAESAPSAAVASQTLGTYMYVIGQVYGTSEEKPANAWGQDYPMAYGENGTWTITIKYDDSITGDKGFKFRRFNSETEDKWSDNFGLWNNDGMSCGVQYESLLPGTDSKNIWFTNKTSGTFTLTLTPKDNAGVSTYSLDVTEVTP